MGGPHWSWGGGWLYEFWDQSVLHIKGSWIHLQEVRCHNRSTLLKQDNSSICQIFFGGQVLNSGAPTERPGHQFSLGGLLSQLTNFVSMTSDVEGKFWRQHFYQIRWCKRMNALRCLKFQANNWICGIYHSVTAINTVIYNKQNNIMKYQQKYNLKKKLCKCV